MTTAATPVTTKPLKISGTVQCWNLGDTPATAEEWITVNTNYGTARQIAKPYLFSAQDGTGEQRANKKTRLSSLKKAFDEFRYTPTVWYGGVRDDHKVTRGDGKAEIEVSPDYPLPLTDASHRRTVLEELRLQSNAWLRKVDNLSITCIIHIDPNKTKRNFLNLQDTFKVDGGQLLTMKITNGAVKKNQVGYYKVALEVATTLHQTSSSHLYRLVKFDTQSGGSIPFKSVAQSGKSDLATSLYGTAILAEDYKKDGEWAASMVLAAYESLQKSAPELLKKGNVLAPEPDGTMGGSTMIIGLGNMIIGRMKALGREVMTDADDKWFIKCAKAVFAGEDVGGNFSGQRKRALMNQFAQEYFRDLIEDEESVVGAHEGIPIFLCLLLGTSAFNVTKFAKPKAKRGRKPKQKPVEEPAEQAEPAEPKIDEVETEKVVESDTDPEWVDDEDDEDAPPWIDEDHEDPDDPFAEAEENEETLDNFDS